MTMMTLGEYIQEHGGPAEKQRPQQITLVDRLWALPKHIGTFALYERGNEAWVRWADIEQIIGPAPEPMTSSKAEGGATRLTDG